MTAIPKSSTRGRQEENLASTSLRLTPEEIGRITSLGDGGHRLAGQDPATYEEL